jgi:hypothetical protein
MDSNFRFRDAFASPTAPPLPTPPDFAGERRPVEWPPSISIGLPRLATAR